LYEGLLYTRPLVPPRVRLLAHRIAAYAYRTYTYVRRSIVHEGSRGILVTHKTLTRGHVAFDTSGLLWKIAVRLDSPYLP
jgi:hypothetical protein